MNIVARLTSAALAASFALAGTAQAQNVTFTGSTMGCFYTTTVCTPGSTSSVGSLTFNGGSFIAGTTSGFGAIGDNSLSNNLGTFSLPAADLSTNFSTTPTSFLLHVAFTTPAGMTPNPQPFTATMIGAITQSIGGLTVDFTETTSAFSFTGGTGTFKVNDVSITNNAGSTRVEATGRLTATVVPEPGTYLLMASGLAGLGIMARRRRNNA